jgi:hypothetical protein
MREVRAEWQHQGQEYTEKITKLIKYHEIKGKIYDVIPITLGVNKNDFLEKINFYNKNDVKWCSWEDKLFILLDTLINI